MVAIHHAAGPNGLQIRAQFLRSVEALSDRDDVSGGGDESEHSADTRERTRLCRRGHWLERDLRRAIAAARRAGLERYRVEIAPDGTITIEVGLDDRKRRHRGRA